MKPEWEKYLDAIGINRLFLDKVIVILNFYEKVYPKQVEEIFVSEYVDKDGKRQYENLWLFSESTMMEAKQFLSEDDFDSTPLKKQVKYWAIKKTDYEFDKVNSKSRMNLYISLLSGMSGNIKASSENCDFLKKIFLKYIIPNAIECANSIQTLDDD